MRQVVATFWLLHKLVDPQRSWSQCSRNNSAKNTIYIMRFPSIFLVEEIERLSYDKSSKEMVFSMIVKWTHFLDGIPCSVAQGCLSWYLVASRKCSERRFFNASNGDATNSWDRHGSGWRDFDKCVLRYVEPIMHFLRSGCLMQSQLKFNRTTNINNMPNVYLRYCIFRFSDIEKFMPRHFSATVTHHWIESTRWNFLPTRTIYIEVLTYVKI